MNEAPINPEEWLFQKAAFGKLPLPSKKNSFLDVDALKSLLPNKERRKNTNIPRLLQRAKSESALPPDFKDESVDTLFSVETSREGDSQLPPDVPETEDKAETATVAPPEEEDTEELETMAKSMGMSVAEIKAINAAMGSEEEEEEMARQYKDAFKKYDTDGGGTLSPEELREMMNELGEEMDEAELDEVIAEADVDGDGHIDCEEFIQMMKAKKRVLALAASMSNFESHEKDMRVEKQSQAPPLPPLKIAEMQSKRHLRQFDAYYTRPTPHCLKIGNQAKAQQLRRELNISKKAIEQLDIKVMKDVEWVREHCPVTSLKAQLYCQKWGVEKLQHVLNHIATGIMSSALRKWLEVQKFLINKAKADYYLKCRGSKKLTTLLQSWRKKKFLGAWNAWMHDMERQRRAEQEAAVVEMQRIARGFVARCFVLHIHENKAAVRMQANARGFLGRKRASKLSEAERRDKAARLIQHQYRGYAGKMLGQHMMQARREDKAASVIQRRYRGHSGRRMAMLMARHQQEEMSATLMQRMIRGREARHKVAAIRQQVEEEHAALAIQTRFRGHQGRHLFQERREQAEAARAIQRRYRGFQSRHEVHMKRQEAAALKIQCMWRGRKGRYSYHLKLQAQKTHEEDRRRAALKIQCMYRSRSGRIAARKLRDEAKDIEQGMEKFEREKRAALRIQAWFRGVTGRMHLHLKKRAQAHEQEDEDEAAARVQGLYRAKQARAAAAIQQQQADADREEMEQSALKLQSHMRGKFARDEARKIKESKAEEARLAVEHLERKEQETAATKIQCLYRSRQARKRAVKRAEELEAEAKFRAELLADQETLHEKQESALHIQCAFRKKQAAKDLQDRKRQHALELAQANSDEERAKIQERHEQEIAARKIQTLYRSKVARKELKNRQAAQKAKLLAEAEAADKEAQEMASIKMQSHFRGHMARQAAEQKKMEMDEEYIAKKKEREANKFQDMLDRERSQQDMEEQELAAIKLQSRMRVKFAQREYAQKHAAHEEKLAVAREEQAQTEAALRIQCKIRQKTAKSAIELKRQEHKKQLEELMEQENAQHELEALQLQQEQELAAMRIQSIYRGRQARKDALEKRKEHDERFEKLEAEREELAATKLQAMTRGHLERKTVEAKQKEIESGRAARAKKHEDELTKAAGGQANEWVEYWDDSSQCYYYFNTRTEEASWTKPGIAYGEDGYDTSGNATDYDTDNYEYAGGNDEWVEYWDDSAQAYFYYNTRTEEAAWDPPASWYGDEWGYDSGYDSGAYDSAYDSGYDEWYGDEGGWDDGTWEEYYDEESGAPYYYNSATGETQW